MAMRMCLDRERRELRQLFCGNDAHLSVGPADEDEAVDRRMVKDEFLWLDELPRSFVERIKLNEGEFRAERTPTVPSLHEVAVLRVQRLIVGDEAVLAGSKEKTVIRVSAVEGVD